MAVFAVVAFSPLRADVLDDTFALQRQLDEARLDLHGGRWTSEIGEKTIQSIATYAAMLTNVEAQAEWKLASLSPTATPVQAAEALGQIQGLLQHVAGLEMIATQQSGNLETAREWRASIKLPKYANAVEGALALQRMGGEANHRDEVSKLLAREYVVWQITRAREKADNLARLVSENRAIPELIAARAAEIQALSKIPASLLGLATGGKTGDAANDSAADQAYQNLLASGSNLGDSVIQWRLALETTYPNLLSEEDVDRRERILLKLLRLIPTEFQSGVRDGKIVIPIEYREAITFTIQCQQTLTELMPVWRQTKAEALKAHGAALLETLDALERTIKDKQSTSEVEKFAKEASSILQKHFGLSLKRYGKTKDVVDETVLDIRSLLGQSLAAAEAGNWRKAEALRLDAYVNFDLEIESRALPRDPSLAMRAERTFLDGDSKNIGIKAALDKRAKIDELTASYQRALDGLDECAALLKVGLSPEAAIVSAMVILTREGLEAVVILAALLAGLRGAENTSIRKRVASGAWLALVVTIVLFFVSQSLLSGLSRYGETLEAVISILAVIILLMVTNWVFHKVYWVQWNAKLRVMSKGAQDQRGTRMETWALIGVGFMTIFREGFETSLFLQSLILEAGLRPVLIGLSLGGGLIAILGFAVFAIGARLPYRKMLVYTGVLVVFVLFTFVGSTVRLFQTVGWLPVHPIHGLEFPSWMGIWLGLYPTWEGVLFPLLSFVYVGGAWLWVKLSASKAAKEAERMAEREPALVH